MRHYNKLMKKTGFTVVELIVVITAIGILASISVVAYLNSVDRANDVKIRSTVDLVGDALQLYEMKNNQALAATGYFNVTNGVDTLAPDYLKFGYRDNSKSKKVSSPDNIFRYYSCSGSAGGFVIYASLNNPTAEDSANFTKYRTACSHNDTQAPTSGSNVYNYAKIF